MRKLKLLLLLTLTMSVLLNAQETETAAEAGRIVLKKVSSDAVPQVVVSAITKDFPGYTVSEYSLIPVTVYEDQWAVTEVRDKREDGARINHYVATLSGENLRGHAVYNADGEMLQFKVKIKNEELPEPAMKYIKDNYSDWGLTDDKEKIKVKGNITRDYYKVRLMKGDLTKVLFFTGEGKLFRER